MANGSVHETQTTFNNAKCVPLYQCLKVQPMTSSTTLYTAQQPKDHSDKLASSKVDDKKDEYVIKFKKGTDVKQIFKDLYSLYGPVFVACHIAISLTSLGFFCMLVYFSIDLTQYVPEYVAGLIGEKMTTLTGTGGKFVVAYAVHKILLPIRLTAAIYVTRTVSNFIRKRKKS